MRVIHIACTAPPKIGGIGSVALAEVRGLRAHGVDAQLFVPRLWDSAHFSEEIVSVPAWSFGNAAFLHQIYRRIEDVNPDIVHLHYPFYGTAERLLLSGRLTRPVVVSFHMDAVAPGIKGAVFDLHRLLFQGHMLLRASRILVSSMDYARASSLAEICAADPQRVLELPFGFDPQRFFPGSSQRELFGLPLNVPMILFVGGLDRAHAFKGLDVLLRACARLSRDTHLVIAGDGDLRSDYAAQARAQGIADRVHFLGRVSDEDLAKLYRSCDVVAFPSLHRAEAFGLVALEAQACGKPVVASALPGVRIIVQHEQTGLLVEVGRVDDLAQALQRILRDESLRQRLGARAAERARDLTWDRHVSRLLGIYHELCALPS